MIESPGWLSRQKTNGGPMWTAFWKKKKKNHEKCSKPEIALKLREASSRFRLNHTSCRAALLHFFSTSRIQPAHSADYKTNHELCVVIQKNNYCPWLEQNPTVFVFFVFLWGTVEAIKKYCPSECSVNFARFLLTPSSYRGKQRFPIFESRFSRPLQLAAAGAFKQQLDLPLKCDHLSGVRKGSN